MIGFYRIGHPLRLRPLGSDILVFTETVDHQRIAQADPVSISPKRRGAAKTQGRKEKKLSVFAPSRLCVEKQLSSMLDAVLDAI